MQRQTYSFFMLFRSWKALSTGITAWPRNTSSPMRARCITVRVRSPLPGGYASRPPFSRIPGCSSNAHSSPHSGSVVFSITHVEYFSLPSWMMVYTSLVPCLPFARSPRARSTVTCTCVGTHRCSSSFFTKDMVTGVPHTDT